MEGLAPPLRVAIDVYFGLLNGKSVRESLRTDVFVCNDDFSRALLSWYSRKEQGLEVKSIVDAQQSAYRKTLFSILEQGLNGISIMKELKEYIEVCKQACSQQIDEEIRRLPYLGLLPLMFFMFPALMLVILSPIILQLTEGLT